MGKVSTGLSMSLDGFIAVPRCAHAGGRVGCDVQGNTQGMWPIQPQPLKRIDVRKVIASEFVTLYE